MYKVCDYYEDYLENIQKVKNIKNAIKICVKRAKDYKALNENIKLLDYERTYKNEKLVYGVYCIDRFKHKIVKDIRVYEN